MTKLEHVSHEVNIIQILYDYILTQIHITENFKIPQKIQRQKLQLTTDVYCNEMHYIYKGPHQHFRKMHPEYKVLLSYTQVVLSEQPACCSVAFNGSRSNMP